MERRLGRGRGRGVPTADFSGPLLDRASATNQGNQGVADRQIGDWSAGLFQARFRARADKPWKVDHVTAGSSRSAAVGEDTITANAAS